MLFELHYFLVQTTVCLYVYDYDCGYRIDLPNIFVSELVRNEDVLVYMYFHIFLCEHGIIISGHYTAFVKWLCS